MTTEISDKFEIDDYKWTELDRLEQEQYDTDDDYGVVLYRMEQDVPKYGLSDGDLIIIEKNIPDPRTDKLTPDEVKIADKDSRDYLLSAAQEWADNEDDSLVAEYRWGIKELDADEITDPAEYKDECAVMRKDCMYGCNPIDRAYDADTGQDALDWVNRHEPKKGEVYYLSHNEAGAPSHYIVPTQ